jgi:DNA-binding transcriptional regulator YiaG
MTAEEFKSIRKGLGLSLAQLGEKLRVKDQRTMRRWEDGEKEISGPVSILMELAARGVEF